ncbi:CYTH domain-containing protein [Nicoletella semolina]|uniref:CYTH domain-containing protein n=1 Tax=Nicoletella semolina TaxID=271160 RepID=A0A4R2N992_9PAST|nr:CYTH domain-containing protein [Nicoletella semolina]MDH2925487.1 hypothetical protein [Nicoletella semolina]TCP17562.1 CYTH domain-containing protein [Nicoletella semolina]
MENEIELKIMLFPEHISIFLDWIHSFDFLEKETKPLKNTYYDSAERFFAAHKMGLRVRSFYIMNENKYELTLKTEGDIIGGLHIRPEYNVELTSKHPDLKKLVKTYSFPNTPTFNHIIHLQNKLQPVFTTDFTRQSWLIAFQDSNIEIALDQGKVTSSENQEEICEIEFELKSGDVQDLIDLLSKMPVRQGMWFSSLSKAKRGYLLMDSQAIAENIEKLTARADNSTSLSILEIYQLSQNIADMLRMVKYNDHLAQMFFKLNPSLKFTPQALFHYLFSEEYFLKNIHFIKQQLH